MKKVNILILLLTVFTIALLLESCKEAVEVIDLCENVICENGGSCCEGECDCPEDYIGINCESFNPASVQSLLDSGKTPKELLDGNIPLDSLYGNRYQGGLIFYVNEEDGTGMVAAAEDQDEGNLATWGCVGTDILGLNNVSSTLSLDPPVGARIGDGAMNTDLILAACSEDGIAAKLCRDLGPEWFLPSHRELTFMFSHLNLGAASIGFYWDSTEKDENNAWTWQLGFGGFVNNKFKSSNGRVRAAKVF